MVQLANNHAHLLQQSRPGETSLLRTSTDCLLIGVAFYESNIGIIHILHALTSKGPEEAV